MPILNKGAFEDVIDYIGDDSELKERILQVISLESIRRKHLLRVLIQHSPKELKRIFNCFLDDEFTGEVLRYFQKS